MLKHLRLNPSRCHSTSAVLTLVLWITVTGQLVAQSSEVRDHFESRVRPILVRACYDCHSGASTALKGGLRLDFRDGWVQGGDSGPAIVPGDSDASLLVAAIRQEGLEMPPGKSLRKEEVQAIEQWIKDGAWDPRDTPPDPAQVAEETFDAIYDERMQWWSLQPVAEVTVPETTSLDVSNHSPAAADIDRFLLSRLEQDGLTFSPPAEPSTLLRRAHLSLTGLPPSESDLEQFLAAPVEQAWPAHVDRLLASPHFGERWARHWMDVVRYTDTYGYEWDMPAKGAFRFRDYLIRAFNSDVGFDQLIREQVAGDLLPQPRRNSADGINESLIGPMFYQMGEKRHGDSAEFNGIHQEMLDNKIDAFGKAFLACTISCARCHDHKLDAVSQKDYYALAGLLISSRWITNTIDLPDRNATVLQKLSDLKRQMRPHLASQWRSAVDAISVESMKQLVDAAKPAAMEHPLFVWADMSPQFADGADKGPANAWLNLRSRYDAETERRAAENKTHFEVVADFRDGIPAGWSVDGTGTLDRVARGDFVVVLQGESVVQSVLMGGLATNALSPRLNGAVRTPWTRTIGPGHLSFEVAGGDFAAVRTVVDNAFLTERQQYLNDALPKWKRVDSLSGLADRNVYIEFATKTSNPNFPPRVGLGGACSEEQAADPKSWFQLVRVVKHSASFSPHDELLRFRPLLQKNAPASLQELRDHYCEILQSAVTRWEREQATDEDIQWINGMLSSGLLSADALSLGKDSPLASLRDQYRTTEQQIRAPETVNGMADVDPAIDYRLNVRGDYDNQGDAVPHGAPQFLFDVCGQPKPTDAKFNRLQLAELIASEKNPLTARVYVNRVWHWLFGQGLVSTVDDFGQAGQHPSHPELLDYLADRFMQNGWSTKTLVRDILLTRAWQQSQATTAIALQKDPTNRLLHHFAVQRLDAESLRDSMLSVSGRLDRTVFGPTTNPWRLSEDAQKRLFSGPLDGLGRRSIYTRITIMEPPRFLATFNQPAPKIPTGRRDVSNTPAQSLTLLNDPFVSDQAEIWARELITRKDSSPDTRIQHMFLKAFSRPATSEETSRWAQAAREIAVEQGLSEAAILNDTGLWKALAHAVFNTKEFLYVR
jgi:hypothetical protein